MRTIECDVVVVGAGPAGSMTAKFAAQGGADVVMIEKRPEIGSPVRCGEGIARSWLDRVGITVEDKWIARKVKGAKIVSPSGKHSLMLDETRAGNEVGYVVDRVSSTRPWPAMRQWPGRRSCSRPPPPRS